jgi:hypothetical protein
VATGAYVTIVASFHSADHKVTDNGDGTLTAIVQTPHNNEVYDQRGQVIARRAGLFRDEVLIDNGGTPTEPSDDEFLGYVQRVKIVGLGFDFCAVLVQGAVRSAHTAWPHISRRSGESFSLPSELGRCCEAELVLLRVGCTNR